MFKLPLQGTKAREMLGDMHHVAELLQAPEKLPTFGHALIRARRYMRESGKAVARVSYVCMGNCNIPSQRGRIVLVSVGPRGGWRKEWTF